VTLIKLFGTTDNYNMQATERLHIDFTKDAYRATNTKDKYPQMTLWLEQKEKILRHNSYVTWCLVGAHPVDSMQTFSSESYRDVKMPKHPSVNSVSLDSLAHNYSAKYIRDALAHYIVATNHPTWTACQVEDAMLDTFLPFRTLPIFHKIKYSSRLCREAVIVATIHARLA
jgi:hypothetical protein